MRGYIEAIGTGLFTSRGPNRFGFAHQTFAECLAAQYLAKLPLIQIRRLLCRRDGNDEHVVPQLSEMAAWLAGMRDDFFGHLLRWEPEIMLRSDVSKAQHQRKAELVEALLERAKRGELFDERNTDRFLSTLNHPKLGQQLRPYMTNASLNVVVRRIALKIASLCRLSELTDDLLAVVMNQGDNQHIRDGAASALEHCIPDYRLAALIPLAKGEMGADPDDTIKGCALRRLVPIIWPVAQTLPLLRAPQKRHFFGSYQAFLEYHLPTCVTESDLPALLVQLMRWNDCFDGLSVFGKLADKVFAEALQRLDNPQIRRLAVRVWVAKDRRNQRLPRDKDSEVVQLLEERDDLRLAFVEAIINDPRTREGDVWHLQGMSGELLLPRDLCWALGRIVGAPPTRRAVWAEAILTISQPEAVCRCSDLFVERVESLPELKAKFPLFRSWALDGPEAASAKANWLEHRRDEERFVRRRTGPDVESLIRSDLELLAQGKTHCWMYLCEHLSLEQGQLYRRNILRHDVTEYPGWKTADDTRRARIVDAARNFLVHHGDGYAEIGDRTNYSDPGYIAIWLLRNEIRDNIALRTAIANKWIDGLIGYPINNDEHYRITAKLAYGLNPEVTLLAFVREIREDDARHGLVFCLRGFEDAWDDRFSEAALGLASSSDLKPGSIGSILEFIGPRSPFQAAGTAKKLLTFNSETGPPSQELTVPILVACLQAMATHTWDFVLPILESESSVAERVFLGLAQRHGHEMPHSFSTLSERQLADLYILVRNLFPPETDPVFEGGFVPARQSVVYLRTTVLDVLQSRATPEACRELLRLAHALPVEDLPLRWRHRNAVTMMRRKSWAPPSPRRVLELTAQPEKRLVNDEQDLTELIVESLGRLQDKLTHSTLPSAELLWNWEGADNCRTDFKPKDEAALSNYVAAWLRDDLGKSGIVVGREVQPRQGKKTDIWVSANPHAEFGTSAQPVTVVIEVKGCWHREVREAAEHQLVKTYLEPNGLSHGIYLVGWFVCERWKSPECRLHAKTYEEARREVTELAAPFDGKTSPQCVQGVVLNCGYPS